MSDPATLNTEVPISTPPNQDQKPVTDLSSLETLAQWTQSAMSDPTLSTLVNDGPMPADEAPAELSAADIGNLAQIGIDVAVAEQPEIGLGESSNAGVAGTSEEAVEGYPPYTAPLDVIYPSNAFLNPHVGSMDKQPVFNNLPAGSLYRPAFLPSDIDSRIDKRSVWMGIEKTTGKAVYFLPPTCRGCNAPAVAQFCDRGQPKCSRCSTKGLDCVQGTIWGIAKPKGKRRPKVEPSETNGHSHTQSDNGDTPERRFTSDEKGKFKASPSLSTLKLAAVASLRDVRDAREAREGEEQGRGKRVKKKRRLSASDEVDPIEYLGVGIGSVKKAMKKMSKPELPLNGVEGTVSSAEDRAYKARMEANAKLPLLKDMKDLCPVWAMTKRALFASAEYFRQPVKSAGASVEIGIGGIARGVILEGQAPRKGNWWGRDEQAGSILATIGPARSRRFSPMSGAVDTLTTVMSSESTASQPDQPGSPSFPDKFARPISPRINILPTVTTEISPSRQPLPLPSSEESSEISALLAAQRCQTPIAIAVSQDYSELPFRLPKPMRIMVLGWFWVVDAWVEYNTSPSDNAMGKDYGDELSDWADRSDQQVGWTFRFDWCDEQPTPWWEAKDRPDRQIPKTIQSSATEVVVPKSLTGGPTTLKPWTMRDESDGNLHPCTACGIASAKQFVGEEVSCLNEGCRQFAGQVISDRREPCSPRPAPRVPPSLLGLRLRPPEPSKVPIVGAEGGRKKAGQDFWRAWVCEECGMANERRKWAGWDCEACDRILLPERKTYEADYLRAPTRPVCTGPRQDDGFPSFTFPCSRAWTLFQDNVKVVHHSIEAAFGEGAEVHHALASQPVVADAIFRKLQTQGPLEVPFRRHTAAFQSSRSVDKALSPYYTFLCGPDAPSISSLPSNAAMKWNKAPDSCLDTVDLINEIAGRMFPGQREFNSLLIAAFPPSLPPNLQPRITLPAHTNTSFLFLGSDGGMRFGTSGKSSKLGEITAQHGDVIGVKLGDKEVQVTPTLDGFGFLCIARAIYHPEAPQDIGRTETPESEIGIDRRRFSTSARSRPRAIVPPKLQTKAPKLLPGAPLTNWYIGCRPLDISQPLRQRVPLKQRPVNTDSDEPTTVPDVATKDKVDQPKEGLEDVDAEVVEEKQWTGTREVGTPPPMEILRPPPVSPMGKKKKIDQPEKPKGGKSEKGAKADKADKADKTKPAKKKRKSEAIVAGTGPSTPAQAA